MRRPRGRTGNSVPPPGRASAGRVLTAAVMGLAVLLPGCGSDDYAGASKSEAQEISALYRAREDAAKAGDVKKACNWRITDSGKRYEAATYKAQAQAEGAPAGFGGDSCEELVKSTGIVFGIAKGDVSLPELCDVPKFWDLVKAELAAQGLEGQSCGKTLETVQAAAPEIQKEFAKQAQGLLGASLESSLTAIKVNGSGATAEVLPKQLKAPTQYFTRQDGRWLVTGP